MNGFGEGIRWSKRAAAPLGLRGRLVFVVVLAVGGTPLFQVLLQSSALCRVGFDGVESRARAVAEMVAVQAAPITTGSGTGVPSAELQRTLVRALELDGVQFVRVLDASDSEVASTHPRGAEVDRSEGPGIDTVRVSFGRQGLPAGRVEVGISRVSLAGTLATAGGIAAGLWLLPALVAILVVVLCIQVLTKPLFEVIESADRIASGALDVSAPEHHKGEVGRLARAINRMARTLDLSSEEADGRRAQLEQVLENLPAAVAMFDLRGRYLYANPGEVPDPTERTRALGRRFEDVSRRGEASEDGRFRARAALESCVRDSRTVTLEETVVSDHGSLHFLRFVTPIFDAWGEPAAVVSYGLDISDLRAAERQLSDVREQLAQAQRLESIGRLAGGIAHDFNNLLTHIIGYADLMLLGSDDDDPIRSDIGEIQSAARKAAELTQQLLAFSRKQVRQTRLVHINEVVESTRSIIVRALGEGVELELDLASDLAAVRADPTQLEQVLVNLTVNARDAMTGGGMLRIRSQLAWLTGEEEMVGGAPEPGAYIVLSIEDTGSGMDAATVQRIFEPFFTTKGPNEGTGLGLATVYGIVQQNAGSISVRSTPGQGTQFRVFLPRETGDATTIEVVEASTDLPRGTETILVTDDQAGLAEMARKILAQVGYTVLVAALPEDALAQAQAFEGEIHLLLTDVVMPQMSGPELAGRLTGLRPGIKVLFMSGYTDDHLAPHGVLEDHVQLLPKPFTARELAHVVRRALERTPSSANGKTGSTPVSSRVPA